MFVPKYSEVKNGTPSPLTPEQIKPFIHKAMTIYQSLLKDDFGDSLISVEEAVEIALKEHYLVLINGEYLVGYTVGNQWYSTASSLVEEYTIRVGEGKTSLQEVFDVLRALTLMHGARECLVGTRAPKNKRAIRKLYERYGLTETMTIMRC